MTVRPDLLGGIQVYDACQQSQPTNTKRRFYFRLVDSGDYQTGKVITTTGVKMELSKNGTTPVASTNDITAVDTVNEPGEYYFEATATEVNTLGQLIGTLHTSGSIDVRIQVAVVPSDPYTAVTAANIVDSTLDEANGIETGLTLRQLLKLLASVLLGKVSGMETTTPSFRAAITDAKVRVSGTSDANGNRSSVTTDPS